MKPVLLCLILGASLAANVWLAADFFIAKRGKDSVASTETPSPRDARAATGDATAPAVASDQPFGWRLTDRSDAALRDLAARLRAAGFPRDIVATIIGAQLRDRVDARQRQLPFWRLLQPDREARALRREADEELARLQEKILGADGTPAVLMPQPMRQRRFGALSDDKVNAVLKIENESRAVSMEMSAAPYSGGDGFAERQRQRTAWEAEKFAAIAAVLSPEEFMDYRLKHSQSANRVLNSLGGAVVSEAEFKALFAIEEQRAARSGILASRPAGEQEKLLAADDALNQQIRAVLSDERYYQVLRTSDRNFDRVATFTERQPGVTLEQAYQLSRLQTEFQIATRRLAENQTNDLAANRDARARTLETFNARLEALLGAETAEAFRNDTLGREFRVNARPRLSPSSLVPPPSGG